MFYPSRLPLAKTMNGGGGKFPDSSSELFSSKKGRPAFLEPDAPFCCAVAKDQTL
ncbi:hypothetical protein [Sphingopyxis flava]|uniref:hypothetical protein n=1 Tax=Sphingopyxis flava TaxID=1507287 RepID=UPI001590A077|nr:hypothetical protein [Sphingopyxis flava]